jgi:hypothetical protein
MTPDRPCPCDDCRQRFHSDRALAWHYDRQHAQHGRWRADRQLVADGGTAEHPPTTVEDDATLEERLRAIQLCVHEENWSRAEDGLLHVLSEVRKRKGGSDD